MALSLMRRHAKSWLIKFLIGIIAVVFIFYFGYSFTARQGVKIAYVNGELISGIEYQKAYNDLVESFRSQYKDFWNDNLIKVLDLKNRALNNLINNELISQEARRLGLEVTESESQKAIMSHPAFQIDGSFDIRRYKAILAQNRMKPEEFEASMAHELLDQKLKQFLSAFIQVTDRELLDQYTYDNEKIKVEFVRFKPEDFKKSLKSDPASMETYFKKHKEDYRVPEKIDIAYILIDPEAFENQVKITDAEIKDYYEYHLDTFKQPKKVRARHILFRLEPDATEEQKQEVRKKAEEILEKVHQGKDFAAMAEKYSEGPTSSKGGDLGYFSAGQLVKPFEDAVMAMKKGEVTGPVQTQFGYHIIKVEDIKEARTKPLDEVRDQIKENLIRNASTALAHEKGLSVMDQMPYDVNLAQYAADHSLTAKNSGFFSLDQNIPGIGGTVKLREALFALQKGETSEMTELEGKFYIFQVADRKDSYLPKMDEVADRVKTDFVAYLAKEKAGKAGEDYLAELRKGKTWSELALEKNVKPDETDFFTRNGTINEIGYDPSLNQALFDLNREKPYLENVFKNDEGAFVIKWDSYQEIDQNKFKEEKEKYRSSLLQKKHMRTFENWLEALRKDAKIEIVTPVD